MADLVELAFADEPTARRALAELVRLQDEERALSLRDWALVVREADGRVVVRESGAPSPSRGSAGGAAVGGGLVGMTIGMLLFAPLAGLMVGTLVGATLGRRRDTGVDPDFALEASAALQPGAAALVLYVVASDADRAIERLQPFAPTVVRTSLTPEDEAALASRLGGVEAAPGHALGAAEPEGVFNRSFGRWYPTDFVVALVDDPAQAERAAAALATAGFPQADIAYRESAQVLQQVEASRRQEGTVRRLVGSIQEHLATEGQMGRQFLEAAQRGNTIIAVRAETPERVAAAQQALRGQGARSLHHFGRWTVTNLSAAP
jgi:uncharacterized membrane protein